MSNTVITNYTDLNGPTSKADSSVVVIVNKDGSLSVDQNLLGTLMGSDGSQGAGISVVRVGHEGRPDDATDSENDDEKVPHVTLSVDSYYNEPNSIIKYDSGAEMLHSLRIETRETSLLGFQNDHCYTPLTPADQTQSSKADRYAGFDDPIIEIKQQPPPRPSPIPSNKKITILDQQIIPKGRKIVVNASNLPFKSKNVSSKSSPALNKSKSNILQQSKDEETESSDESTEDSGHDRDSDSDYKDATGKLVIQKKTKGKPRILKNVQTFKRNKPEPKQFPKGKPNKSPYKPDVREKVSSKRQFGSKHKEQNITIVESSTVDLKKDATKSAKKEKKPPAHMNALLSDMSSLFSSPDVIRRISTDNKSGKDGKSTKTIDHDHSKDKSKNVNQRKQRGLPVDKATKGYELIPQIDDASLAQILQDTSTVKGHPTVATSNAMNSPGLAGPLSPTLDILSGLHGEEEGLTEDLLMHVAQLVESSENLQEVIDKQVLGKVDSKTAVVSQSPAGALYAQTPKTSKIVQPAIEVVRKDGRIITLPPIEAPATRSSKRKTQGDPVAVPELVPSQDIETQISASYISVEQQQLSPQYAAKQYINRKLASPKKEEIVHHEIVAATEKVSAESQESWNSEDDPNRLWCICRQPHNNRFMICCDGCEDWFHGKCVNITKAMGQQMEEQGIEWRCPNCLKKNKPQKTLLKPMTPHMKRDDSFKHQHQLTPGQRHGNESRPTSKSTCIVCKKPARASSIYCSDSCILKHAQDSLEGSPKAGSQTGKPSEKGRSESKVIVFERKTGRCLAGPNAPTAENLKAWLQKHPTFEVIRPGALNTLKPNVLKRKSSDSGKIQTTLNFERVIKKPMESSVKSVSSVKEAPKVTSPKPENIRQPQLKSPPVSKPQRQDSFESSKPTTPARLSPGETRKIVRTANRSQSAADKLAATPSTSRQKIKDHTPENKNRSSSGEPIRENVRKALQEQMSIRMAETSGPKFTEKEIQQFAVDTEAELHELFRDVGVKYKAKYRSLMFNIKDRKNQSLWQKICDKSITPNQLVRFSPEELASQELAQWRDKEAKHQLELIKKNELDLLAASKTYVLKTHKGEEVMETKTATTTTDVDPNVRVEDLVTVLNDSASAESKETDEPSSKSSDEEERRSTRKRSREDSQDSGKKRKRESERKSKSSDVKSHDRPSRRSGRTSTRRSSSKERSKKESKREDTRSKRDDTKDKRQSVDSTSRSSKSKKRSRSISRERSTGKSRRDSQSRDESKRKLRSRSKTRLRSDDKTRSKSQESGKKKHDSSDPEAIERPKSAMMKEVHPEYDPHEPMITSAFSEEDLRKSGDDYDAYKSADLDYESYDPEKAFTIEPNILASPRRFTRSQDKPSVPEPESDQEPSSTVENAAATVWSGCINMVDVARFYVSAHEVSGISTDLEEELSAELDVVGRINPDTVWDYIVKMRKTGNKDIVILRLQAANDEEKMQYIALYSYLNSRNRLGVVKVSNASCVKDFYIVPLAASASIPPVLLPLEGPGLEENRSHLLLAVVVRQRKKRPPPAPRTHSQIISPKVTRSSRKRSYTPPPASIPNVQSYSSPTLSTTVKDKIAATIASTADMEPYSPGSSSNESGAAGPPSTLKNKMEELNRQIEEQKQQIQKMVQADSSVGGEDEAYSPSRPMTPPSSVPLADIALPSNLQEILATIKQRSNPDVDMRTPRT